MAIHVLGGGSVDGKLGVNPEWSTYDIAEGRVVQSLSSSLAIRYHIIEQTDGGEGNALSNGLYANTALLETTAAVNTVNGKTGSVELIPDDLGLGNIDNTSDLDKPISTLSQAALDDKASKAELRRLKLITSAA